MTEEQMLLEVDFDKALADVRMHDEGNYGNGNPSVDALRGNAVGVESTAKKRARKPSGKIGIDDNSETPTKKNGKLKGTRAKGTIQKVAAPNDDWNEFAVASGAITGLDAIGNGELDEGNENDGYSSGSSFQDGASAKKMKVSKKTSAKKIVSSKLPKEPKDTKPKATKAKKGPASVISAASSVKSGAVTGAKKKSAATKASKGKPPAKAADTEALVDIFEYLKSQNRPFNTVKIFENLNKKFSQKQVKTILETLVGQEKISEKGGIFWVNQALMETTIDTGIQGSELENELKQIKAQRAKLADENKVVLQEIDTIRAEPSDEQLIILIREQEASLQSLKGKQAKIPTEAEAEADNKEATIDNTEKLMKAAKFYLKEWKDRKTNVLEAATSICEGSGQKIADFFDEVGVDLDEGYDSRKTPKNVEEVLKTIRLL